MIRLRPQRERTEKEWGTAGGHALDAREALLGRPIPGPEDRRVQPKLETQAVGKGNGHLVILQQSEKSSRADSGHSAETLEARATSETFLELFLDGFSREFHAASFNSG